MNLDIANSTLSKWCLALKSSPKRMDSETGSVNKSYIKSIGEEVRGYNINLNKQELFEQVVESAAGTRD